MTENPNVPLVYNQVHVDAVITKYHDQLVGVLLNALQNRGIAEDIAQECWIELCKTWQRWGTMSAPQRKLFKTARQRLIDQWRRQDRDHHDLVGDDDVAKAAAKEVMRLSEFRPGFDGLFTSRQLVLALRQLPSRHQQALIYRYGHDLSIEATAALMACSEHDVKNATKRGLARLRTSPLVHGLVAQPIPEVRP